MHKKVVEVPETIHSWKDQWFFVGGSWRSSVDDFEPGVIDAELRAPEYFTTEICHIPAQETSGEFDERIDKLLEQRKSYLIITEENLAAAGLRPIEPAMSESASRSKTAPARKETPAKRVERLAAERKRRAAPKRRRVETEMNLSASRIELVPRVEEPNLPSPIRTGRSAGKEPTIDLEGHYLPVNKERVEPCEAMKGRRPTWFLDFVRAATPTAELAERVPPVIRESSHIPIRGWTPKMEFITNDMDPGEQVQFGNAQLGRALGTYVKAAGEFQSMVEKYKKASAELNDLREAHHICPAMIKSLEDKLQTEKGEMEILESRAGEAELLKVESREKIEASERRLEAVRADYEARLKEAGVRAESSWADGYARGLSQGDAAFKKSDDYNEMLNLNYISSCQEMLDLVKEGKSVEELGAYMLVLCSKSTVQ
ncbi:hypothetical protein OROHE_012522 [Orobanche hederae]